MLTQQEKFWLKDKTPQELAEISRRRANGEPLQYILGEWEFCGLPIKCDPRALIPRMETEYLVDAATKWIQEKRLKNPSIIDVCCGTGCIALALAKATQAVVQAVDISPQALQLARENAENLRLPVEFIQADLLDGIGGTFELITANPPYISHDEMSKLPHSVKNYEPHLALAGGEDGMELYRRLVPQAFARLVHGGALFVEIGAPEIAEIFRQAGFTNVEMHRDLAGIPRIIQGVKACLTN